MIAVSDFFRNSNYAEAALWGIVACVVALAGRRMKLKPRSRAILAVNLFAFGVSDVVEAQTGAWWDPWWLLVWKGVCVLVFAIAIGVYIRQRRRTVR